VGAVVVLVHALALSIAVSTTPSSDALPRDATPEFSEAQVIFQLPSRDKVQFPDVRLSAIVPNTDALRAVQFEDPDDGALGEIVAPASAPRLRTIQTVDVTAFARRAGLMAGQSKTVVLVAVIGVEGEANQVDVSRSSGDPAVDAVAIDYALALRWIPATRERKPVLMRIRFPVTLAVAQ
jgi:hypothetical protein